MRRNKPLALSFIGMGLVFCFILPFLFRHPVAIGGLGLKDFCVGLGIVFLIVGVLRLLGRRSSKD